MINNTPAILLKFFVPLFCLGLLSCTEENTSPGNPIDRVVELNDTEIINPYTTLENYVFTLSRYTIRNNFPKRHDTKEMLRSAKYDISFHRFLYETTYKGKSITASGMICIPLHTERDPKILSFHHGTLISKNDAPSLANDSTTDFDGFDVLPAIVFSTHGYITFVPDYIGYGSTSEYFHPYLIYKPTVNAVIDMIKNGKEFLKKNKIPFDDELFLAGYSEGGYVTMAVQKELNSVPEHNINVTASAPGAGPYDLELSMEISIENNSYISPSLFSFGIIAFNEYYLNYPLTDIFEEPYASRLPEIYNSNLSIEEADAKLVRNIDKLFIPDFINQFKTDQNAPLRKLTRGNSVYDWKPVIPTRIWQGRIDDIVPVEIAEKTYDVFIENGVDPNKVELVIADDAGHYGRRWLQDALNWIKTFE